MKQEYLDRLRKHFGKTSQESIDNETLRSMGKVAWDFRELEPYWDTPFAGCGSKDLIPILFTLTSSLMLLGCLPLMDRIEKLARDDVPGAMWLTFYCRSEKEENIKKALSKMKGFELSKVGIAVYMLVCHQPAQVIPLHSDILQQIGRVPNDSPGAQIASNIDSVRFMIRTFMISPNVNGSGQALIDCFSDETARSRVMIWFVPHGNPIPVNYTEQVYPDIPGLEHVFHGLIYNSMDQYPIYIDMIRNEIVWGFLSLSTPAWNQIGTESARAGWGHLE
jgi:hypothetical protein